MIIREAPAHATRQARCGRSALRNAHKSRFANAERLQVRRSTGREASLLQISPDCSDSSCRQSVDRELLKSDGFAGWASTRVEQAGAQPLAVDQQVLQIPVEIWKCLHDGH